MDEFLFSPLMPTVSRPRIDLTGKVYGKLTVLRFSHRDGLKYYWICRCECGVEKPVCRDSLRSGHSTSCGCYRDSLPMPDCTTHGTSYTKEYRRAATRKHRKENREAMNAATREKRKAEWLADPEKVRAKKRAAYYKSIGKPMPEDAHRSRRTIPDMVCANCGKTYRPQNKDRKFCSMECSHAGRNIGGSGARIQPCKCTACGKEFIPTNSKRFKYCSTQCRDRAIRERIGDGPKIKCKNCGKEFTKMREDNQYCSKKCVGRMRDSLRSKANNESGAITINEWHEILEWHGYRCAYCFEPSTSLEMDHVIPFSKGGPHDASNIVPACRPCNQSKLNRSVIEFLFLLPTNRKPILGMRISALRVGPNDKTR